MSTAPVVCNSSPLIALAQLGQLELLRDLFVEVVVPTAVVLETRNSVVLPDWVAVQSVISTTAARMLSPVLGPGEREAICLAVESNARLIILDDLPARRTANSMGLAVIGTVGLLLAGKKKGHIGTIKPLLDRLRVFEFRMSDTLYKDSLNQADE